MSYATRNARQPEDLLCGIAGQRMGLLVDDIGTFRALGGKIRESRTGRGWAVLPTGQAYPLTCGDIVERYSEEDGERYTDRCGDVAVDGSCEAHGAAIASYRAMSEAERCHLERMEDSYGY